MRVLLIEDDSAIAQSIELILKSEGFSVYTTDLGEEGIDLGKIYEYDILLLDLNLPDMSGFSNRPFRVKHFQTIRRCSVDVAHGLALLFGIGAKALPLWDSRMRWSNLCSGLAVRRNGRSKRTCELTSSIVPRGTSSTARWSSSFLLLDLIL